MNPCIKVLVDLYGDNLLNTIFAAGWNNKDRDVHAQFISLLPF